MGPAGFAQGEAPLRKSGAVRGMRERLCKQAKRGGVGGLFCFRRRSHLGNGADADAVDEGTLEDLAFLRDGDTHTQTRLERGARPAASNYCPHEQR